MFALALHRAKNVEVMVVNPRAIKDFSRACMQRAKTDAVDAGCILEYLERMPFTAWQPPAPEILKLQAINRRIEQLHTELTREKNRCHAAQFAGTSADAIAHDIEINIRHLERRIERMQESGLQLVRRVPELATKLAHLVSAKGIGEVSAIRLLAELLVLPDDLAAAQWVAHAGLDPRHYESGTSVHRPRRISNQRGLFNSRPSPKGRELGPQHSVGGVASSSTNAFQPGVVSSRQNHGGRL